MKTEVEIRGLKFEVHCILDDGAPWVIYSCNNTRLKCYEHESNEAAQIDYNTICDVLHDVEACLQGA
jgi:hypothetical protein